MLIAQKIAQDVLILLLAKLVLHIELGKIVVNVKLDISWTTLTTATNVTSNAQHVSHQIVNVQYAMELIKSLLMRAVNA